jgi:Ribonuclease G/E
MADTVTVSIRVAGSPGEARVAVVCDDRLVDYTLWRMGSPDGVGDVHRGRVIAHVPAMAGAFVALGGAEGFLPDSEFPGGSGVRPAAGAVLTVRVTRAAQGSKGPRLSARVVASVFDDDLEEAIDALSRPAVELPGGARLQIWPTPALVAIDVDAGGALAGAGGAGARHEAVNRTAVAAVAAQIRLRNLSGGIVVDLAGLSPRRRAALGPDFAAALANDPLRPKFLGFTALGLAEIVRTRIHPPLHELLAGPLAAGLAALRAVAAAGDARRLPAVRAHPAIVSALQADAVALPDVVRRTGRAVTLRSDPSLPATVWMLEKDNG